MKEWPPLIKPARKDPVKGTVGIVLPVRDDLRYFKLCFHSILSFTDYPFMLTIIENMNSLSSRQYIESIHRNNPINVLVYQKDYSLGAMWNLGLQTMFAYPEVAYGLVMSPTVVVEPYWLTNLVESVDALPKYGVASPMTNGYGRDVMILKRSVFEEVGGFDPASLEPNKEMISRVMMAGGSASSSRAYVHKFRVNGFDPKRTSKAPAKEVKEETHAGHQNVA